MPFQHIGGLLQNGRHVGGGIRHTVGIYIGQGSGKAGFRDAVAFLRRLGGFRFLRLGGGRDRFYRLRRGIGILGLCGSGNRFRRGRLGLCFGSRFHRSSFFGIGKGDQGKPVRHAGAVFLGKVEPSAVSFLGLLGRQQGKEHSQGGGAQKQHRGDQGTAGRGVLFGMIHGMQPPIP